MVYECWSCCYIIWFMIFMAVALIIFFTQISQTAAVGLVIPGWIFWFTNFYSIYLWDIALITVIIIHEFFLMEF